jgi:dolichol-phosphate mannosyltransferase
MPKNVAVIIPTLNEERSIGILLKRIASLYSDVKAIVVDDGSVDRTREIVESFGSKAYFLDRSKERIHGLTASVLDGITRADADYIIVMDGDLQHPPERIKEIIKLLNGGHDLVVCVRTSVPSWSFDRKIMSEVAENLARARLFISNKKGCSDVLSGFFGIRADLAKKITGSARFEKEGYKILFDMLKRLPNDAKITEVPYVFGSREGGKSKISLKHITVFFKSLFT